MTTRFQYLIRLSPALLFGFLAYATMAQDMTAASSDTCDACDGNHPDAVDARPAEHNQ